MQIFQFQSLFENIKILVIYNSMWEKNFTPGGVIEESVDSLVFDVCIYANCFSDAGEKT